MPAPRATIPGHEPQTTIPAEKKPLLSAGSGLGLAAALIVAGGGASALLSAKPWAAEWMARVWPFATLAISIVLITILISVVKVHAFLALILAALGAGIMSRIGSLPGEPDKNHWVAAMELAGTKFGVTAGTIAIVIVLASIIGMALFESGAADRIVKSFLELCGPQRAGLALLLATYVVSIPIFFDTIFLLLVPLAQALNRRTRRDYVLYLMAICCAAAITHTMVIPHPGPAGAVAALGVEPGFSILVGLVTGLGPLAGGWMACRWIGRRMEGLGVAPAVLESPPDGGAAEMNQLPSLGAALFPIVVPLALIWMASLATLVKGHCPAPIYNAILFAGHRCVALFVGTGAAIALLMRQRGLTLEQVGNRLGKPLETAGIIILITSAGGAFGASLQSAGIGDAIAGLAAGRNVNLILLAYFVALVLRIAQGSVTVAIMAAAAIIAPLAAGPLPYHKIYLFLAVGYGSLFVSWMNDSGFWVISRLSGLSEKQTLASWTVLTAVLSITGLLLTLLLSWALPMPMPVQ